MKTKPNRFRIRRIFKWGGASVCLLLTGFGAWTSRGNRIPSVYFSPSFTIQVFEGHVVVWVYPEPRPRLPPLGWHCDPDFHDNIDLNRFGLDFPRIHHETAWHRPGLPTWVRQGNWSWCICLPFWLLLLTVGMPTAFMFYRDYRRTPPGHCQKCGYDLTGNVSGKCSECGTLLASN